ncbi:bile acid:sodium symporter family protein [Bacteroidales bacterium OttesenSCG-928-I14]|nr:bile acid:sodium symporter family protein [Bacteroidales bacterium OttesenSCG-928-I14]
MYEHLQALDNVHVDFSSGDMHLVNIILAFIMFGVALDIKISDFKDVFYKPKSLFLGIISQLLVLPLVTFAIVALGYKFIPPGIAMGMILVASCPGGNMSNFISSLAKANAALSVSLTGISTLIAVFMTPLNFKIWGSLYVNFLSRKSGSLLQTLDISFWDMLTTLVIILIIPLLAGMLVSKFLPKLKKAIINPIKFISIIAFFGILVVALNNNLSVFLNHLFYIFVIVLIHNGMALSSGYLLGRIFKRPLADRQTLMIETGIQNSGLGLALLLNTKIFPEGSVSGGMLMVVAWWGVWHIISGLIVAFVCQYKNKRLVLNGKNSR